jgi:hypothetical protein
LQVALELAGASQTCLHAPQLLGLCSMSTQLAPHFWKPSPHSKSQVDALHNALPWLGLGQAVSQSPQWFADSETSRQAPPQLLSSPSQFALQLPLEHTSPAAHGFWQPPQFSGSLSRSTQASPQLFRPDAQVTWHLPATHWARPPSGSVQACPQAPQFSRSLWRSTHTSPQAARSGQAKLHAPSKQMATPWAGAEQVAPQPPQFCGSEASRVQIPSHSTLPAAQPAGSLTTRTQSSELSSHW